MKINSIYPANYFAFEGIDACGKTTQMDLAREYFEKQGYDVMQTRQPGGTQIGQQIRNILLNPENSKMLPEVEVALYCADRKQHMGQLVIPNLQKKGRLLFQDRGQFSTKAYQEYGRRLDRGMIDWLNNFAVGDYHSDSVLLFDISVDEMQKRLVERNKGENIENDRLEREDIEFFERLRYGFYDCKKQNPDLITIINAERSIEDIHVDVVSHIEEVVKKKDKILEKM